MDIYYEVTKQGCKTNHKRFGTFEDAYKEAYNYLGENPQCVSVEVTHVSRNLWSETLMHCATVKQERQ